VKKSIIVTGGDGTFAKILKLKNKKLNLKFLSKKELNILNTKSIENCLIKYKPQILIHTAGLSRPMEQHDINISKSIDLNIIGTANIVKSCKKFNVKVIYFSTVYVYDGQKGNFRETDPVKPINNYALSKMGGECSVLMYKNSLVLRIQMTEKPFLYEKAFSDLYTNFIFHEELVPILPKIINEYGVINIGGKKRSVYQFAKIHNKNVKKIRNNIKLPPNQTMNLDKLTKIIKK
jgi:dTDP-4-dehydrorhamnose reductase